MKSTSLTLVFAGLAIALSGCNSADTDRTTSVPRGVDRSAAEQHVPSGLSAPPAPYEGGPVPANANAAAPGTNASLAFADQPAGLKPGQSEKPEGQSVAPPAQEAAARAPDTASADAAKTEVMSNMMASNATGASSKSTARDTEANSPRHGTLTKEQEVNQLPKAGQVNNHSSTALEKDSGR